MRVLLAPTDFYYCFFFSYKKRNLCEWRSLLDVSINNNSLFFFIFAIIIFLCMKNEWTQITEAELLMKLHLFYYNKKFLKFIFPVKIGRWTKLRRCSSIINGWTGWTGREQRLAYVYWCPTWIRITTIN